MRKWIRLALVAMCIVAFVGCGSKEIEIDAGDLSPEEQEILEEQTRMMQEQMQQQQTMIQEQMESQNMTSPAQQE